MKKIYSSRKKTAWSWLWLSLFIIIVDQITKYLANHDLIIQYPMPVFSFLNFTLTYNTGAAFSLFNFLGERSLYIFGSITILVTIIFLIWLGRLQKHDACQAAGISLIIGGALGNFIDRVHLSYVIDFIDFHMGSWHYAIFNIADSAICLGALLLFIALWAKHE